MKKLYLDQTQLDRCVGVFVQDAEVILAGATVYAMPVRDRNEIYQKFADEFDIHFIFENRVPVLDFYTVPQFDVFAEDGNGGFLGTVGEPCDSRSDAPVCYVDRNRQCFLAAPSFRALARDPAGWQQRLAPYDGVTFYASLADARQALEFIDPFENKTDKGKG